MVYNDGKYDVNLGTQIYDAFFSSCRIMSSFPKMWINAFCCYLHQDSCHSISFYKASDNKKVKNMLRIITRWILIKYMQDLFTHDNWLKFALDLNMLNTLFKCPIWDMLDGLSTLFPLFSHKKNSVGGIRTLALCLCGACVNLSANTTANYLE